MSDSENKDPPPDEEVVAPAASGDNAAEVVPDVVEPAQEQSAEAEIEEAIEAPVEEAEAQEQSELQQQQPQSEGANNDSIVTEEQLATASAPAPAPALDATESQATAADATATSEKFASETAADETMTENATDAGGETQREQGQQPPVGEEEQEDIVVVQSAQPSAKKKKKESAAPKMDPEFFYDYESLVFRPVVSNEANISANIIELFHSFGYDCKKRSNLNILDEETLVFSAGNLAVLLNMRTKEQRYLKTVGGGAVGAIAVHPTRRYFAVGEKGNMPAVNVFEYPSLRIFRILRKGTIKAYAHIEFDPSGELLASLGSAPDFMLTIWDWAQESVVLRTKAFSQDVYKVTFSKDLKGVLTTGGTGHIKFWKMANTFTGYKLQGSIGKFGKTEISDIEGYAELPDGKVLSGSEWGNMLLWDGGLIQTEICRKKGKPCHQGSIQQITLNEGDIYTIGEDGSIRVWDFETIDTAEPSEEGVRLEMEPLNELRVGTQASLRTMVKDEDSTIWYAQDSNGGIWRLDLGFNATSEDPRQLFTFHSGVINGIECSPNSHLLATTADDGSVRVYNYATHELVAQRKFKKAGTALKWLPASLDPDVSTICVGFNEGTLRFLKLVPKAASSGSTSSASAQTSFDLALVECFKPHTKALTRIAIDAKSSIIATGSDDQTVFFFSTKANERKPIGFVTLPSAVTYLTWTPSEYAQSRLLVCMQNGVVHEYHSPSTQPNAYNTSKTYLIDAALPYRAYTFRSIKSRLRHEEELERKRIEEEERKKREAEERRLRGIDDEEEEKKKKAKAKEEQEKREREARENGDDEGGDGADDEEAKAKAKEDEWKPYIPEVASRICWAHYSTPDTFWLSMDDYDAGYLYECRFVDVEAQKARTGATAAAAAAINEEPFNAKPVLGSDLINDNSDDVPLTCMIINKKKTYTLMGQKNGGIRAHRIDETQSRSVEETARYWSHGFHDVEYGHVTNICLSFDEKFLFSAGADGNIFGVLFDASADDLHKARQAKINIISKAAVKEVADIDDPLAYSIEQDKQKSETNKMLALAEAKKQDMRDKINELRMSFKDLSVKNEQLVPRLRLDKNEFLLEESIKQQVLDRINEKIQLTYRELAWNSEKCRIALDKLQSKFKDVIDCESILVFTFDETLNVSTFRSIRLPRDMEAYRQELERQYQIKLLDKLANREATQAGALAAGASADDSMQSGDGDKLDGQAAGDQLKKIFGKLHGNTAAKVERALRKMEERKQKRLKRRAEWDELNGSRLPDDYENPDDLATIKYAEDNLGDFKLKTSSDYLVPENQRMTVFKAVERLMQIKRFIHENQMAFNGKVLTLRDKKRSLIAEINASIDRLDKIKYLLSGSGGSEDSPALSSQSTAILRKRTLRADEEPEKKYEYTKEKLLEFKKDVSSKMQQSGGGAGGAGGGKSAAHDDDQSAGGNASGFSNFGSSKKATSTVGPSSKAGGLQSPHAADGLRPIWHNKAHMSELMRQTTEVKETRLRHEQAQLVKIIEHKTRLFDAELKVLRHEKAKLAVFMKNADLRHVTLFEELMLLKEFEKTENELENKLTTKKEEYMDMQAKLADVQLRIDNKRKDIEKLDHNQKQLMHTYAQLTHDETKYGDFLSKVYKRKIKRKKKTNEAGADEDEESDESDDDDEDDDDEDEDEDDESENEGKEQLDLDLCPHGLKQELFDQVCQLREKRLDLEEAIAEEKKILDQLKKDQDSVVKKGKIAENSLKQVQNELENFQKEKQKKINDLDIVVTMRLNQIQFLVNGRLPINLSESLAFDSKNLEKLQARISDLKVEKSYEKKLFKNLKEHHQELIRDKKKMDEYVSRLDELCNKMMRDKFGKLVDIERLELIAVNQQIEELKQRLSENEFEHERVMQDWLNKVNSEKDDSLQLLKANTTRLNEMVDILNNTKRLEAELDTKQNTLGAELASTTKKDLEERKRLHTLVQLQAQEVEALRAEISILSRKGGRTILPPTQPPNQMQSQKV